MKRYVLLLLLGAGLFFPSCSKEDLTVRFQVVQRFNEEIPPMPLGAELPPILTPPLRTEFKGAFEANNADINRVKELFLREGEMKITLPEGQTWKFLRNIELWIKADGLEETRIAYRENIPDTIGNILVLDVVQTDLKPFALRDEVQFKMSLATRQPTFETIYVENKLVFSVIAYLLK